MQINMATVVFLLLVSTMLSTSLVTPFTHRYLNGRPGPTPSCYLFVTTPLPWLEALNNCHKQGGYLVSIDSQGEQNHLARNFKRLYNKNFWTGGNDISKDGMWQWVADHSKLQYTNWYPNEPNNHNGITEQCLHASSLWNFRWNDAPCGGRMASICEKAC